MKNLLMLLILIFMSGNLLLAQGDWKSGYIIYQKGDTIYGEIKYNEGKRSSSECTFRKDKASDNQTLTTDELSGYRFFEGKFFVSRDIKDLKSDKPIFLEYLIEGKVCLYRYNTGSTDNDRYFAEKEGAYYELKNTTEIRKTNDNSNGYYFDKKEYVGTLNVLFQDANISKEIYKSDFRPNSLINLTKTYHETVCTDQQCVIFERTKKPMYLKFGVLAGVTYNQFNFAGEIESSYSPGYMVGCRFEFKNILDLYEKLSISIDVNLQKYNNTSFYQAQEHTKERYQVKYEGETYFVVDKPIFSGDVDHLDVNMDVLALKIPMTINHAFSTSKTQPYFGAGILNVFVLSQNSELEILYFYGEYGQSVPTYQFGLIGKVGCNFTLKNNKSIIVEGGFEYSMNPEINEIYRMTNKSFNLTCGYQF